MTAHRPEAQAVLPRTQPSVGEANVTERGWKSAGRAVPGTAVGGAVMVGEAEGGRTDGTEVGVGVGVASTIPDRPVGEGLGPAAGPVPRSQNAPATRAMATRATRAVDHCRRGPVRLNRVATRLGERSGMPFTRATSDGGTGSRVELVEGVADVVFEAGIVGHRWGPPAASASIAACSACRA